MNVPTLVVDVGNTSTDLGLYARKSVKHIGQLDTAHSTQRSIRATIRQSLGDQDISRVVLSSVVPRVDSEWEKAIRAVCRCSCLVVDHQVNIGVPITYPKPESLGADRLANVCAAVARFGTPVVVADFGTALNVEVVDATDGFVGGVIAPGLSMMIDYLAERTAKLPSVEPGPVRRAVGKSTEEAIRIGARYGYLGMVRGILQPLQEELGVKGLTVCATGGYAGWVMRGLEQQIRCVPNLTLLGLGRIGDLNEGL